MDNTRPARPALRELRADDHAGVVALLQRHGLPVRSRAGWQWALFDNPARGTRGSPAGWVLASADNRIVGFLGNWPLRYTSGHQAYAAATCTPCVVDAEHALQATNLLRAFALQAGTDVVHVIAADPGSAARFEHLDFFAAHGARLDTRLRWVASEAALLRHGLQRLGLQAWHPLARLAGPPRRLWRHWRGPVDAAGPRVERLAADDLRADWDRWATRFADRPGLWADRSAAAMAWRLADPDRAEDLALFVVRDGRSDVQGMCLARLRPERPEAPGAAELLDWALMPSAGADAAAGLLRAARQWAHSWGAAVLDADRLSGEAYEQLAAHGPQRLPLPPQAVWWRLRSHALLGKPAQLHTGSFTGIDSAILFDTAHAPIRPDAQPWTPTTPWVPPRIDEPAIDDDGAIHMASPSPSRGVPGGLTERRD